MKIERNGYLLLAAALSAAVGGVFALKLVRRQRLPAHLPEHASALKSRENEGGNLAPIPATSTLP
jgi:hypothetical protein